jgi:hypothetical protein
MGYDTKTDRLTDCQSQCDSDSLTLTETTQNKTDDGSSMMLRNVGISLEGQHCSQYYTFSAFSPPHYLLSSFTLPPSRSPLRLSPLVCLCTLLFFYSSPFVMGNVPPYEVKEARKVRLSIHEDFVVKFFVVRARVTRVAVLNNKRNENDTNTTRESYKDKYLDHLEKRRLERRGKQF